MMTVTDMALPALFLLIFAYAEIHYKILRLPSRYFKREPEIIADMPHRIEPGQPLPVLLLVKDAHRFPLTLKRVEILLWEGGVWKERLQKSYDDQRIDTGFWHRLFEIQLLPGGLKKIRVVIHYQIRGKAKICEADNYARTSHKPFEVFFDPHPLPAERGWVFGDLHSHSHYSDDQVEFGAPLSVIPRLAQRMGLQFFAVTDHSYDLDDMPDNYLKKDPNLGKWRRFRKEVSRLNREQPITIVPGEEVSAGNRKNQNVHFLILNNQHFFPGNGDSGEAWPDTRPSISIPQILKELDKNAIGIAAHPAMKAPFLQWLLIRRGHWRTADYAAPGLTGVQMWNGIKMDFLEYGLPRWVELLLSGHRLALLAGNDGHGNFNRFRQLKLPHLRMIEADIEMFGKARTGLLLKGERTVDSIMDALQSHRAIVTDGPFATLEFKSEGKTYPIGAEAPRIAGELQVRAGSTPSFGEFVSITMFEGNLATKKETQRQLAPLGSMHLKFSENRSTLPDYVRLHVVTRRRGETYHCLTNPIYFKKV